MNPLRWLASLTKIPVSKFEVVLTPDKLDLLTTTILYGLFNLPEYEHDLISLIQVKSETEERSVRIGNKNRVLSKITSTSNCLAELATENYNKFLETTDYLTLKLDTEIKRKKMEHYSGFLSNLDIHRSTYNFDNRARDPDSPMHLSVKNILDKLYAALTAESASGKQGYGKAFQHLCSLYTLPLQGDIMLQEDILNLSELTIEFDELAEKLDNVLESIMKK